MRMRILVGALALSVLATGCPQEPEPVAACGLDASQMAVPTLDRGSDGRRSILVALHKGIGSAARDNALDLVEEAAATGSAITIWSLRSSQSSSMQKVLDEDFRGTAETDDGIRFELRRPYADALCDVVASLQEPPIDDGADLLGALERLIDEAAASDAGVTELAVVTGGGVHRTIELELGDPAVTSASFQSHIARLRSALARSDAPPTKIDIFGVGTFEGAVPPPARQVADLANTLWADVCTAIENEGVPCSPMH